MILVVVILSLWGILVFGMAYTIIELCVSAGKLEERVDKLEEERELSK